MADSQTEPQILSESDLDRIEKRLNRITDAQMESGHHPVTWEAARALCHTVRALRVSDEHNYQLWLELKTRHAHKFATADGEWADTCRQCGVTTGDDHDGYDCIAWLQRQITALREQLAARKVSPTTPLLQKIVEIADIGSADEFGDAVDRLRAIRGLIVGENV